MRHLDAVKNNIYIQSNLRQLFNFIFHSECYASQKTLKLQHDVISYYTIIIEISFIYEITQRTKYFQVQSVKHSII